MRRIQEIFKGILSFSACKNGSCLLINKLDWLSQLLCDDKLRSIQTHGHGQVVLLDSPEVVPLASGEAITGLITLVVFANQYISKYRCEEVGKLAHGLRVQFEGLSDRNLNVRNHFPIN
jgi:hypothetical protein